MSPRPIRECRSPWTSLYIDLNGNAKPCCFTAGTRYLGNVNDQTIDEIWNGSEIVRLRGAIRDGYVDPICRNAGCAYVRDTENAFGMDSYDRRCELDTEIDLRGGKNPIYLVSGWSSPDQPGVWTDSVKASLMFDLHELPKLDLQIEFLCRSLGHDMFPNTRIYVQINGRNSAEWNFIYPTSTEPFAWRKIHFPIKGSVTKRFEVVFTIEKPISPKSFGEGDTRELGLLLGAFKVGTVANAIEEGTTK